MEKETIVDTRPDRELKKRVLVPGDYSVVPYEDSRCRITLSEVRCSNSEGECAIDAASRIFSSGFDGNVLIGDCDSFIDRDFELILQRMCCGETCAASLVYRDGQGALAKELSCTVELREVMEEQLISDWGVERLFEAALHHKERGVELVKEKRITDAFMRFNKAMKMLIAIEPVDPKVIDEDRMTEMTDLKVKLYNNLAHCQLQYNEYDATIQLCDRALELDPNNIKALFRKCSAHAGLKLYEEAWADIQHALSIDPNDKASIQKANAIRPLVEKINKNYTDVIKKMFG